MVNQDKENLETPEKVREDQWRFYE